MNTAGTVQHNIQWKEYLVYLSNHTSVHVRWKFEIFGEMAPELVSVALT